MQQVADGKPVVAETAHLPFLTDPLRISTRVFKEEECLFLNLMLSVGLIFLCDRAESEVCFGYGQRRRLKNLS